MGREECEREAALGDVTVGASHTVRQGMILDKNIVMSRIYLGTTGLPVGCSIKSFNKIVQGRIFGIIEQKEGAG